MATMPTLATHAGGSALTALNAAGKPAAADRNAKAREAAVEFEAVFLSSMLNQMFSGLKGEGPFGGGAGTEIWRSFLSDEYAKSFAKAGGIGIADQVYRTLIAQQEARPS
jgi:Rod binding domain-containing protein